MLGITEMVIFISQMPFPMLSQQCKSTEGMDTKWNNYTETQSEQNNKLMKYEIRTVNQRPLKS